MIPAIALVFVVGVFYLRFLLHLRRRTAQLIVLAAGLYVGGAVGFEMISGLLADGRFEEAQASVAYNLVTIIQETFEMLGIAIFALALLHNLKVTLPREELVLRLRLT